MPGSLCTGVDHSRGLCHQPDIPNFDVAKDQIDRIRLDINPPRCKCCGDALISEDLSSLGVQMGDMYWVVCPTCRDVCLKSSSPRLLTNCVALGWYPGGATGYIFGFDSLASGIKELDRSLKVDLNEDQWRVTEYKRKTEVTAIGRARTKFRSDCSGFGGGPGQSHGIFGIYDITDPVHVMCMLIDIKKLIIGFQWQCSHDRPWSDDC